MARILMISYAFPPLRGAESIVTTNYATNLPKRGYEVMVLTGVPHLREADPEPNKQCPDSAPVYRVNSLEDLVLALVSRMHIGHEKEKTSLSAAGIRGDVGGGLVILDALRRFKLVPNHVSGWAFLAAIKGRALTKKFRVDYLVSRSNPVTSHLAALRLKGNSRIPWVACFSDPWALDPNPPYYDRYWSSAIMSKVNENLERKVVEKADRIVFTTQDQRSMYARKYERFERKFVVIPNSYDPKNYQKVSSSHSCDKHDRKFTIVHSGSLMRARSPEPFYKALSLLREKKDKITENIRVILVGESSTFSQLISEYGLDGIIQNVGPVSREEALKYVFGADLLLLMDAPSAGRSVFLPSKLLDYIQTNRPILGITPEGAAADVIRKTQTGTVVTSYNPEEIGRVLTGYYSAFVNGTSALQPKWNEIQEYSIDRCIQRFINVLEELRSEEYGTST